MALPRSETHHEVLRLRARVAELEAELSSFKNKDHPNPASEAEDSSSDDEEPAASEENTAMTGAADRGFEPESSTLTSVVEIDYQGELEYDGNDLMEEYVLPQNLPGGLELNAVLQKHTVDEEREETSNGESSTKRKKKLPCPKCDKKFAFQSELRRHVDTHQSMEEREATKKLECDICGKRFNWNCDLSRHVITHGQNRPHSCTICKAAFKLPEGLKKHMILHTEGTMKCPRCHKLYKNSVSLRTHSCSRLPNRERKFVCETCEKGFTRKDQLNVHKRIHTGERPYRCQICGKSFVTGSKLNKHSNSHRTKPYTCHSCAKSFTSSEALQKHLLLDPEILTESVSLLDIQVTTCTRDRVIIRIEPCLEYSDSENDEMDTSEAGNNELLPALDELSTRGETVSPPVSVLTLLQPSPLSAQSTSTEQQTCVAKQLGLSISSPPTQTLTQPTSSQESLALETTSSTPHSLDGNSMYVQLLNGGTSVDKDGNSLVQLHVQPTEERQVDSITTNRRVTDTRSPSTSKSSTSAVLGKPQALPSVSMVTYPNHAPPPCLLCSDSCDNADGLAEHMLVHMTPKPHKCFRCKTSFETLEELNAHSCKPLSNECPECRQSFGDYCSLIRHFSETHKTIAMTTTRRNSVGISKARARETLTCWYCERSFPSECELSRHKNESHSGSHPFSCEHCDKSFPKKQYLRAHTRTHTGERQPHSCEYCEKSFSTRERLKIHTRSHTGERPYKCQVCGEGFVRRYILKVHTRLHTGEKPYRCDYCGKLYRVYTDCRIHTEEVHEGRRVVCGECGKTYKRAAYRTHVIRKHKKSSKEREGPATENGTFEGQEVTVCEVTGIGGGVVGEAKDSAAARAADMSGASIGGVAVSAPTTSVVVMGGQLLSRLVS